MGSLKRKIERELEAETGDPRIRLNSAAYKSKMAKMQDELADRSTGYRQLQGSAARQTYAATVRKEIRPAAATMAVTQDELDTRLSTLNDALGLGNY